jgi:hypothetical protein
LVSNAAVATRIIPGSSANVTVSSLSGGCTPPPSGMVGWYPGDGNANDISGTQNHGMFVNGATTAPGMVLQAFSFDGVNDYVEMPAHAAQDPTTTATLDAWVFFNQTPSAAGRHMEFISKGSFGSDLDLGALTDNRFYLYVGGGGINVGSTTIIQTGVWYHVAGTWDATGLRMYVNGVLENTNPILNLTRAPQPTRQLSIGNGTEFDRSDRWFSGLIDEAEIINRALSLAEIQAIFNAGSAGKCKGATAAQVTVSGRVTNIDGRGIGKVRVFLTGADGDVQTALTNPFGYFRFEGVEVGETYVFTVSAKRYSFNPSTLVQTIDDEFSEIHFVADN